MASRFRCKPTSKPMVRFKLGGATPGDGALPGSYKAIIMPVALGDAELAAGKTPSVAGKFTKFETYGHRVHRRRRQNRSEHRRVEVNLFFVTSIFCPI